MFVAPATRAQDNWSRKVLAERDTDKKEQIVCVDGSKSIVAEAVANLAGRERHGPAVAAAAGQYFEKGKLDANTPAVLRLLAKRPDIDAQAIAYAALSPSAPALILGLASSDEAADHLIAARMIAATAVMRLDKDRLEKRLPEKIGAKSPRLNVNYRAEVAALLEKSRDPLTLEYLLLATAVDRIGAIKDSIPKHANHKDAGVAMAAQYALGRVKGEVDPSAIMAQIKRRPKKQEDRPGISYDPRDTPRIYAILAAGEAKIAASVDPLFALLKDRDLHTAVAAARALSRFGGEGMAVRLLNAMDEDTPWPVRVAIYDAAGEHPDADAIALLQEHFENEDGRFRQDALYAILSIVAGKPGAMTIEAFEEWWALNGEAFKIDIKATREWRAEHKVGEVTVDPIAGFYESAVISDRPVFAVDASLSMKGIQIESLKSMLDQVVLSLPGHVKFNIVDFGGHVRVLAPGGMIPAENRKRAMEQFKYDMELTLGTRTYDAIERAILIPEMDTVHFLSDGGPYGSQLASWQRINYVTRLTCRTTPVAVNIIFFPEPKNKAKAIKSVLAKQMKIYALGHAGNFVVSTAE